MSKVAVLFASKDSVYKSFSAADVYDEDRDARTYTGNLPVIAHPPCRGWGRLRHLANVQPGEIELAFFAVEQVRLKGGVLEHPAGSKLWEAENLPLPGHRDLFGGWTLPIYQSWFGHPAPKNTWLYICGIQPKDIPAFPMVLGYPMGRVQMQSVASREKTPPPMATWLLDLAMRCGGGD